jgi:hypothetical protein
VIDGGDARLEHIADKNTELLNSGPSSSLMGLPQCLLVPLPKSSDNPLETLAHRKIQTSWMQPC